MQVMYYKTSNFIRHEGNVIDLVQYRQKLAEMAQERMGLDQEEETPILRLVPQNSTKKSPRSLVERLDLCATLGVVAMTLVAVFQFASF